MCSCILHVCCLLSGESSVTAVTSPRSGSLGPPQIVSSLEIAPCKPPGRRAAIFMSDASGGVAAGPVAAWTSPPRRPQLRPWLWVAAPSRTRRRTRRLLAWRQPRRYNPSSGSKVCHKPLTPFRVAHQRPGDRGPLMIFYRFSLCLGRAATAGGEQVEGHVVSGPQTAAEEPEQFSAAFMSGSPRLDAHPLRGGFARL